MLLSYLMTVQWGDQPRKLVILQGIRFDNLIYIMPVIEGVLKTSGGKMYEINLAEEKYNWLRKEKTDWDNNLYITTK